jgi:hypothetical protein
LVYGWPGSSTDGQPVLGPFMDSDVRDSGSVPGVSNAFAGSNLSTKHLQVRSRRPNGAIRQAQPPDVHENRASQPLCPPTRLSVVELPGIEPAALPGQMPSEPQFRSVSFQFSPARHLRFRLASWRRQEEVGRKGPLEKRVSFETVVGRALESLSRFELYAALRLATTAVWRRGAPSSPVLHPGIGRIWQSPPRLPPFGG